MASPTGHVRVCPTRIDGAAALFAHRVTVERCQDRQRGRYHKCFTCVYNNAYAAIHGLPAEEVGEDAQESPSETPVEAS